ncbi:MAG: O-antigen ligase family protein [Candidatus Falkowbacteria bacterium]|nr:O-antigen ligase family protein [Candidatus Falkowbacteria bacterium]
MKKINNKNLFFLVLGAIAICEVISFTGFFIPQVVNIFTALVILATLFITLKKPAYGFLILLAELLVGSQGYLLWIGETGNHISLRIALWIIVMVIWFVKEIERYVKEKDLVKNWISLSVYFPFLLLLIALIVATVNGFLFHNDSNLIFIEAKRWLYILTIIPLLLTLREKGMRQDFSIVIAAACTWLALKTLLLLYIFSHGLVVSEVIYAWTRADLLGEITTLANGFSRVFLQSQVFAVPAFIFSAVIFLKTLINKNWKITKSVVGYAIASALFLSVIIISLSRSFWFGLAVGALVILFTIFAVFRPNIKQCLKAMLALAAVALTTIVILFITLEFPFPKPLFGFNASLLSDRANANDAAADSRWALLPVMNQAIFKHPIMGYGLGKTLTYKSSDPRVVKSSTNGTYTTNAFEWGWLDIWLKLGSLGMLAYLWFLLSIMKQAILKIKTNPYKSVASIGAMFALIALNIFTPYLNHPLGFAYLAIIMVNLSMEE